MISSFLLKTDFADAIPGILVIVLLTVLMFLTIIINLRNTQYKYKQLLPIGSHQPHHWAMASGENPHSEHTMMH